jgi:hypothetical protein
MDGGEQQGRRLSFLDCGATEEENEEVEGEDEEEGEGEAEEEEEGKEECDEGKRQ